MNIVSKTALLVSLTQKSDELSPLAASNVVAASISLLQSAMQTGLPYESAEGVLVAADDGMSRYVTDILTVITSTLGVYGSLAASQLFGGQSVVHVLSHCRLTTTSISGGASNVSVPRTVYEELQVKNTSTIHFLRNQSYATDMKVTVAEFKADIRTRFSLYGQHVPSEVRGSRSAEQHRASSPHVQSQFHFRVWKGVAQRLVIHLSRFWSRAYSQLHGQSGHPRLVLPSVVPDPLAEFFLYRCFIDVCAR